MKNDVNCQNNKKTVDEKERISSMNERPKKGTAHLTYSIAQKNSKMNDLCPTVSIRLFLLFCFIKYCKLLASRKREKKKSFRKGPRVLISLDNLKIATLKYSKEHFRAVQFETVDVSLKLKTKIKGPI
jgi:hypothetical protein